MKKLFFLLSFTGSVFLSKTVWCQQIIDTPIEHDIGIKEPKVIKSFVINGRVIGVNLENVQGVSVTNIRTGDKVNTDSRGLFQVNIIKGDTLTFSVSKYSKETRIIKYPNENLNVIMIKRKVDELPSNYSQSDYNKASREDDELYHILEKDAKLEDKWKY